MFYLCRNSLYCSNFTLQLFLNFFYFLFELKSRFFKSLLQIFDFRLIFQLNVLKRLNKLFKNVHQTLGLIFIFSFAWLFLVFVMILIVFNFLSHVMIFINQHFKFSFNFLMILVDVIAIGEFFNRFCQLGIDLYQLFQRLFQNIIFLLKLAYFLSKLFMFTLACEVVLKTIGHRLIEKYKLII